jgi:porphobilinogen deaminase
MTGAGYRVLSVDDVLPAPGQAALAVQGRADDAWLRDVLSPVNDPLSAACLRAERLILQALSLDCQMPFAALCEPSAILCTPSLTLAAPSPAFSEPSPAACEPSAAIREPPDRACDPSATGFRMRAWLADPRTGRSLRVQASAPAVEPLVAQLVQRIEAAGRREILDACRRGG